MPWKYWRVTGQECSQKQTKTNNKNLFLCKCVVFLGSCYQNVFIEFDMARPRLCTTIALKCFTCCFFFILQFLLRSLVESKKRECCWHVFHINWHEYWFNAQEQSRNAITTHFVTFQKKAFNKNWYSIRRFEKKIDQQTSRQT